MKSEIYKTIMVATDGSELCRKAIDTAIEIAKLSGAKLYALYVISTGEGHIIPTKDVGWEKAMREHLIKEGEEATAFVQDAGKAAGVEVESVILEGNPGHEIVEFAEKNDIDLIVMGTLGKTGIQRFLLGSVAENVVRHSRKAVVVARGEKA